MSEEIVYSFFHGYWMKEHIVTSKKAALFDLKPKNHTITFGVQIIKVSLYKIGCFLEHVRNKNREHQNGESQYQHGDGLTADAFPFLEDDAPDIAERDVQGH